VDVGIVFVDRPEAVIEAAGGFLSSQPVVNNLILSLLSERMAYPQAGRYWVATDGRQPLGVVLQSPLDFPAAITPMPADAVAAVVRVSPAPAWRSRESAARQGRRHTSPDTGRR
jgi:hypothetical protein